MCVREAESGVEDAEGAFEQVGQAYVPQVAAHAPRADSLAARAANVEQYEDALAAIEEAVAIRRPLSHAQPEVFAAEYADSLRKQAIISSALGREAS